MTDGLSDSPLQTLQLDSSILSELQAMTCVPSEGLNLYVQGRRMVFTQILLTVVLNKPIREKLNEWTKSQFLLVDQSD